MSGSNVKFNSKAVQLTFNTNGNFVVPNRIYFIHILGVGAGAGGDVNTNLDEGAAAGKIDNIYAPVTPGETVTITIGTGGAGDGTAGPGGGDGGNTVVDTLAKDYYFLGGKAASYDSTVDPGVQQQYGVNGTNTTAPGGQAGYGDGGNAGTTFQDGGDGGIGAGGGSTSDAGQVGGDGGDGLVIIWYQPID